MMKLIATRGDLEAWAPKEFDPKTDKVELRRPGGETRVWSWQQALKMGYWEPAGSDEA